MASSDSVCELNRINLVASKRTQVWKPCNISDQEFKTIWRIMGTYPHKTCTNTDYYCALGTKCRALKKKKVHINGVSEITRNDLNHSNHLDVQHELIKEQKQIIVECISASCNVPNNILLMFRAKEIPEPNKMKISGFLQRCRNKQYHTEIDKDIGDVFCGVNNMVCVQMKYINLMLLRMNLGIHKVPIVI